MRPILEGTLAVAGAGLLAVVLLQQTWIDRLMLDSARQADEIKRLRVLIRLTTDTPTPYPALGRLCGRGQS